MKITVLYVSVTGNTRKWQDISEMVFEETDDMEVNMNLIRKKL